VNRFLAFGIVMMLGILATAQAASARPTGVPSVLTPSRAGVHADARVHQKPTLFVLMPFGLLNEYDLKGKQVGQIQLSDTAGTSLCSDGEHYLYVVSYQGSSSAPIIARFPIGSTTPDLLMYGSIFWPGYMCAVSRMNGDIALTIQLGQTENSGFMLFHAGQTTPYTYDTFQRGSFTTAPTFGRFGNLFVVGVYNFVPSWWSSQSQIIDLQYLPVPRPGGAVGAQIDRRGKFVIQATRRKGLLVYPPGALKPGSTIKHRFVRMDGIQSPYGFEFTPEGDEFFTIDTGHVYGFLYPQGGYPVVTINVNAIGIAIVPGPHPG
jgi:hypothetical protein